MRLKATVKFGNPAIAMCVLLMVAEEVFTELGYYCMITSFNDSVHGTGSLHPKDQAADFRTVRQGMTEADIDKAVIMLRERLTDDFDIVKESNHIHGEYDPK